MLFKRSDVYIKWLCNGFENCEKSEACKALVLVVYHYPSFYHLLVSSVCHLCKEEEEEWETSCSQETRSGRACTNDTV